MIRFAAVAVTLALTACAPGTKEACIAEYGGKAATKGLVRAAYNFCPVMFDQTAHPISRDRAACIVKKLPDLQTDAAFYAVRTGCDAEYPTPACPAGETFSFENDKCERPYVDPFDP